MSIARINLPPKLVPVFSAQGVRYRAAYGGRGSGKTRTFAKMAAVHGYRMGMSGRKGSILCGREYMNSLEDSSLEEIKQAIYSEPFLLNYYNVGDKYIKSHDGNIKFLFAGLRHNLDSIKSKSEVLLAWVDEADAVSDIAWRKLRPSVRAKDSEIWATWNPEIDGSATDSFFIKNPPSGLAIANINYQDNPFFSGELENERLIDLSRDPDMYAHVWDGQYLSRSDAQIFAGRWDVKEFTPGKNWDGAYFGLDFGFSQDPTAAVKCWIYDDQLWIEYEAGKAGLELDHTPRFLIDRLPDIATHVVRADSARPESISYLRRFGVPRCTGVEKGKGSVEDGIAFIKSFLRINIHPRCEEVRKEFRLYSYKVDRLTSDVLPQIVDKHNHYIDALRYALEPAIKAKNYNLAGML